MSWDWGLQMKGFLACGVGPSEVFGVEALYRNKKNNPGKKNIAVTKNYRLNTSFSDGNW